MTLDFSRAGEQIWRYLSRLINGGARPNNCCVMFQGVFIEQLGGPVKLT